MESLTSILRLGLGGLLLDPAAFRAQRDDPERMRRGLVLIVVVGLIVGAASWLGDIGEFLTSPDPTAFTTTLYEGIAAMPIYEQLVAQAPELSTAFEQSLTQQQGGLVAGPLSGALGLIVTPLLYLLRWLVVGAIAHIAARAFGGTASFGQTLGCTALATGVDLLAAVQLVPYAQVAATTILGLLATYVAVREAHGLTPWRSFFAVTIGPLLLALILGGLVCCTLFLLISAAGSALQGAAL